MESGNAILQDQLELVIDAIREVVEAVHDPSTWAILAAGPPLAKRTRRPGGWDQEEGFSGGSSRAVFSTNNKNLVPDRRVTACYDGFN